MSPTNVKTAENADVFNQVSCRTRTPALKRATDVVVALLLLPLFVPIIAIIYLIVRLDGGTGFFGHKRVGAGGQSFKCWKIRTMVPNAEAVLSDYLARHPDAAAEWERDFKLSRDPRVTRIGQFLRETSLDELPQIWNVLSGDMSFVGPRPVVADELGKYCNNKWCYLSVKPGVTGLWQISGRNDVSYGERIRLDMHYATSGSLCLDLKIIVLTGLEMLKRTGR
jgi:lipopolysaccharide/colanic/teichoic acid biosynthesis glycosyltransferase